MGTIVCDSDLRTPDHKILLEQDENPWQPWWRHLKIDFSFTDYLCVYFLFRTLT